jgi:CheY-like chemotaxis protein
VSKLKCPRCSAAIDPIKDELGIITCSSCGARLRTKVSTKMTIQGAGTGSPPSAPEESRRVEDVDRIMARIESRDPNETLRPVKGPSITPRSAEPLPPATLDALLAEIRSVRQVQEEILTLLRERGTSPGLRTRPPRARRRSGEGRTVIVADDDPETLAAAAAALEGASMRVVTSAAGDACLAAIAKDKPDVVVLELALGGAMAAKDVIDVIKATMEWVDIPIVLHTRTPFEDEAELLLGSGADAAVAKGPGSERELCARVDQFLSQHAASV